MIEQPSLPSIGRVALRAIVAEVGRDMVRIAGTNKVVYVTIIAEQREILVLIVHMAPIAGRRKVRTCERKSCRCVIECRGSPAIRSVARLTIRRVICREVIGRLCCAVCLAMTGNASCICSRKDLIAVTGDTARRRVSTLQWKGSPAMVESLPPCKVGYFMTISAASRETGRNMVGCIR